MIVLVIQVISWGIFSFVIITCYFIFQNWDLIVKDSNLFSVLLNGLSTLFGALIGGFLSLIGNKIGAKEGYLLATKNNEDKNTRQIIKLLKYTVATASAAREMLEKMARDGFAGKLLEINLELYDNDWPNKLGLSCFNDKEYDAILKWLRNINLICDKGMADAAQLAYIANNYMKEIEAIIEKYSQKS